MKGLRLIMIVAVGSGVASGAAELPLRDVDLPPERYTLVISTGAPGPAKVWNASRAAERFTPYSTFKIANSLIALESGVVSAIDTRFPFDPERHRHPMRRGDDYNSDQTLESAFKVSAVWTFQEIARQIGRDHYAKTLQALPYGNADLSGGIDRFWLSTLKISALEQVHFLTGMYHRRLGFSERTTHLVKKIMTRSAGPALTISSKTGTGKVGKTWLGWLVGSVEDGEQVYFFALNCDASSYREIVAAREQIFRSGFATIGIGLPPDG